MLEVRYGTVRYGTVPHRAGTTHSAHTFRSDPNDMRDINLAAELPKSEASDCSEKKSYPANNSAHHTRLCSRRACSTYGAIACSRVDDSVSRATINVPINVLINVLRYSTVR